MSDAELSGLANWLFGHGLMLFYGTLLCSVIGFAVLEWAAPKFSNQNRSGRWPTNFLLFALIFLIQLFVPVTALMAAIIAENTGMGLLNWLALPLWARGVLTLVVVDLVNYLRHWAFHKIPLLWRIHKIHHSDVALDASTFGRFHPLEIVPDLLVFVGAALVFGLSAPALFAYELLGIAFNVFTHANVRVPGRLERALRVVFVTPDMHHIHHSRWQPFTDSNYGVVGAVWDRLFGTYQGKTDGVASHAAVGLDEVSAADACSLWKQLWLPFAGARTHAAPRAKRRR